MQAALKSFSAARERSFVRFFSSQPRSTNLRKADHYITKMSQSRKDKIGGLSVIDKQWAEKPMAVIKSPHKLTEVELYQTLQKIVEMPEKRLKTMIKQGGENTIDEVFLLHLG